MVSELAGLPHEGFVLQVLACYLLVDVLQANEKRPVTKPEAIRAREASETTAAVHRAFGGGNGVWRLPWRLRLGHPHEIHVAGQQGEVRHVLWVVGTAEVAVGQQNVDDQLQVGFPSNRLPEQNHSCD